MIEGLGIDLLEAARFAEALRRHPRMAERCFTPAELAYCRSKRDPLPHLAARFAAKEAVAKALGRSLRWQEVEIESDGRSQPRARLTGEAARLLGKRKLLISLTHADPVVAASAIAVRGLV